MIQKAGSSTRAFTDWKAKVVENKDTCIMSISLNPTSVGRINSITNEITVITGYYKDDLLK